MLRCIYHGCNATRSAPAGTGVCDVDNVDNGEWLEMMQGYEEFQKLGKENVDLTLKSFGTVSKGMQTIAMEMADYSKKSFEEGAATVEKLAAAKSLDKAIEIQSEYARSAYEGWIAQATRIGELYTDLAKGAYKPFETAVSKAAK